MLKMKKKNFIILLILVFVIGSVAAFGGTAIYLGIGNKAIVSKSEYTSLKGFAQDFSKLYETDAYVKSNFLWDYNTKDIQEQICKDFVKSLGDKYSIFMNKEEYDAFNNDLSGSFFGVGLTFIKQDGQYLVQETIDSSPAQRAGFKKGDVLLKVDGKTYKDQDDMMNAIRGPKGSKVTIQYLRGGSYLEATMIREEITVSSVQSKVIEDNIGYIRISEFDRNTGESFENELTELENKGVKGLVIDLRLNGGGYVSESVKVADLLLPACTVTSMTDKNGKEKRLDSDASCTNLPYVLIVDSQTASAAEILAGAVKDNKGGKIVGTKTFGKGIVQSPFELSDGSCVKLTTMEYLTPNGNKVHKKGIKPDFTVKLKMGDATDYQLNKALELLK
ncbi:MAG: S41 family peptidase [Clostridia bacterium]|nr:S41 family peptidase [Clostridia bacterium]